MPSETMNHEEFSPTFYSEQRQVGLWKMNTLPGQAMKMGGPYRSSDVASPPLGNNIPLDPQSGKGFDLPDYYLRRGQKASLVIGKHVIDARRAPSHSLPSAIDRDRGTRSSNSDYLSNGDSINIMDAQSENGLFSSSLSDLFSEKLSLSTTDALYGHSVGANATPHYEEETFESMKELEAQTIGSLLPDDDDLLSGVTDGFDYVARPSKSGDVEDFDLFSSVGGLELGEDGPSHRASDFSDGNSKNEMGLYGGLNAAEHPFGEHPSRTLFVRNINSNVEDSELKLLFEQYGDIHKLYTACKNRGFVMISYYDIRAARRAMEHLQNSPLRRRKLDIHFSIPKDNPSEKDINQGTLMVMNLDSSVSNDDLRQIFSVYGEVKEICENPNRSHHKFIEFYDVRAAEAAYRALNRSDIGGKHIKLETNQAGDSKRSMHPFYSEFDQEESNLHLNQNSPPINMTSGFSGQSSLGGITSSIENGSLLAARSTNGGSMTNPLYDNAFNNLASSSLPKSLPSLMRAGSAGNQPYGNPQGHLKFEVPNIHPHSRSEYNDGSANEPSGGSPSSRAINIRPEMIDHHMLRRVSSNGQSIEFNDRVFGSPGNGSCPPPGRHYIWSNSHHPQPQGVIWQNSPSFVNGIGAQQLHVPRAPSHMLNALLPLNNHHVGSAPSVNPSPWDRRHAYTGDSTDATVFHPGSLGSMRISGNSPHPLEFVSPNIFPHSVGDLQLSSKNISLHPHNQRRMVFPARGQMIPMMSSFDSPIERSRGRRNEGSSSQADNKKQFELDLDRIVRGEDKRTTLMIKNIPNKYTSKMLLAAIDERHRGTYDFIYLPIDFKNKCNVGYAFINMTDPSLIIPFYQTFNGKKWEKFNSEKVATLAYARIQGKAALIAHFQNSSLMNEDKRCRPILFHTDGPNAGDQVPFPMGSNIRSRPNKNRASSSEDIAANSGNGEEYGDSASGSGKESD